MPQKTEEDFFDDEEGKRFFRTGDIGQLRKDGSLRIIDRKKDLVKLQGGEYVSLGKVEASLKSNQTVENICVYADPRKLATVALIVPDDDQLKQIAQKTLGSSDMSREEMCGEARVVAAVLEGLRQQGASAGLERWEIPKAIKLVDEPWTPESGLVTAAFKLRRRQIQDKFQELIDLMYGELDSPTTVIQMEIEEKGGKKKQNGIEENNNFVKVQSAKSNAPPKQNQVSPA